MPSGQAEANDEFVPDAELQRVLDDLRGPPRRIDAKYFYDARGSVLFEQITHLPEYYLTRCELEILQTRGEEIVSTVKSGAAMIELGAASSDKVRPLLEHLATPGVYVALDISEAALERVVAEFDRAFPELGLRPVQADFTAPIDLDEIRDSPQRVLFYPGSTIGNFDPHDAQAFLTRLREAHLRPGDLLLLGVDLQKDPAVLDAAYNDAQGVTAAFNKNVLRHLDARFGGDLDPEQFEHLAFYDPEKGCVEMHLRVREPHIAELGGDHFAFGLHETIHTESSWKYTRHHLRALGEQAGFFETGYWTDRRSWFGVWRFEVR